MKRTYKVATARAALAIAVSAAMLHQAAADTIINGVVVGNLPACSTMLTNCLNFSQRATMAAGPGGTIPDNISAAACQRMANKAQATGFWPDNQPFGFAESCATDPEKHSKNRRHHAFPFQSARANTIQDPAALPDTPPLAADATHGGY